MIGRKRSEACKRLRIWLRRRRQTPCRKITAGSGVPIGYGNALGYAARNNPETNNTTTTLASFLAPDAIGINSRILSRLGGIIMDGTGVWSKPFWQVPGMDEFTFWAGWPTAQDGTPLVVMSDLTAAIGPVMGAAQAAQQTADAKITEGEAFLIAQQGASGTGGLRGVVEYGAVTLADRDLIPNPQPGEAVDILETMAVYYWNGSAWVLVDAAPATRNDWYIIRQIFGTWEGVTYNGNASARIFFTGEDWVFEIQSITVADMETIDLDSDGALHVKPESIGPDQLAAGAVMLPALAPEVVVRLYNVHVWEMVLEPWDGSGIQGNGNIVATVLPGDTTYIVVPTSIQANVALRIVLPSVATNSTGWWTPDGSAPRARRPRRRLS